MIMKKKPTLRNCEECGKVFVDNTGNLTVCSKCYEKQREDEKIVIEYVREHPHSTIKKICKETGATFKLVSTMVQRGQFFANGGQVLYPCSRCRKPISHGLYCPECAALLNQAIRNSNEIAKSRERMKELSKELGTSKRTKGHRLHWMDVRDKNKDK